MSFGKSCHQLVGKRWSHFFPLHELLGLSFILELSKHLSFYYVPDTKYWRCWDEKPDILLRMSLIQSQSEYVRKIFIREERLPDWFQLLNGLRVKRWRCRSTEDIAARNDSSVIKKQNNYKQRCDRDCQLITKFISSFWAQSQTAFPSLLCNQVCLCGQVLANGVRAEKCATFRPGS